MNVVLLGTPEFSVPVFEAILSSRYNITAVVSQPDRAKDRSGKLIPTPLKKAAQAAGVNVLQFVSLKKEGVDALKKLNADIFVTAAYGQLLSQEILDIPKHGVINVHGSLLPLYRGSSPVQQAILNGDKKTGITIMQTRLGLDSGEIILQESLEIGENETVAELMDRLSHLGARLSVDALELIERGEAKLTEQDETRATYCSKITAQFGRLDFGLTSKQIHNLVRAVECYAFLNDSRVKILQTALVPEFSTDCNVLAEDNLLSGEAVAGKRLIVRCGDGFIEILKLVPQGGKVMSGKDFLLGRKNAKIIFN